VRARVTSLDSAWFAVASTYVSLARKDGETEVVAKLEEIYRAAADAVQATLRPEIQLLNRLLAARSGAERQALYAAHADALARHV
jgi:hypothetical protein